jgi:hypothetical protein
MLVLPNKTSIIWNRFLKENEVLVYKYIVREIRRNIEVEQDRIDLFKFEDDTMHAWIPKNKVLITLQKAMKVFIKAEEYEYARKADNVIQSYHINKLIKDSTKSEE